MVEGIMKMLEINNKNGLDVFKELVSLPGLTQRYLMKNLSDDDYFFGIGKEHEPNIGAWYHLQRAYTIASMRN